MIALPNGLFLLNRLNPGYAWVAQQARNFSMLLDDHAFACRYIIHDRDTCFLASE